MKAFGPSIADAFRVCSINAPFILGYVEGMSLPHLSVLVQYAQGTLQGVPLVAPAGGVNHITSQSMAQAIEGTLARGKGGHAYLVGDENLSWKDYLELYFLESRATHRPACIKRRASFVSRLNSLWWPQRHSAFRAGEWGTRL